MSVVLNRPPDDDVAEAIQISFMCQEYHCLPGPGGLLDQDGYRVWQMNLVRLAQLERQELDAKKRTPNA